MTTLTYHEMLNDNDWKKKMMKKKLNNLEWILIAVATLNDESVKNWEQHNSEWIRQHEDDK